MTTATFFMSLLALLLAPGPTNALLALAGAERGAARALRLLPAVALAYGASVLPLSALGEALMQQQHAVRAGVTFAAALWIGWMAVALWRRPSDAAAAQGGAAVARLAVTTLLNPKAFVIGLVLIPAEPSRGAAMAAFFLALAVAGSAWIMLGAALGRRAGGGMPLLRRICAGWLGLLALMLGSAALSA